MWTAVSAREKFYPPHTVSPYTQQLFTCGQQRQQQQRSTTATDIATDIAAPEFKIRYHRTTMGGAVERYEIDMQETQHLDQLSNAIHIFQPTM